MSEWQAVTSIAELNEFLSVVGGFHDGILKEVHWRNRDWIDEDLTMRPNSLADARMLVQRQWRSPSAVELMFENVWRMRLDTVGFVFDSEGKEEMSSDLGEPRRLLVLQIENSEIAFERMKWRDASEWMGPDSRFATWP